MEKLNEYVEAQKFLETLDWDNIPDSGEPLATICEALQDIQNYKDLEEQGLLLRLPCGIGSDIYFIPSKTNYKLNILQGYPESNRVYHQNVEKISFTQYGWYLECDKDIEYATGQIFIDKLYKETWFLTQAEAEQKLKEMESD